MARTQKRKDGSAWERRNARARALGYHSYYDYRSHNYGKIPPGEPAAKGETLRRLRGHIGRADFLASLSEGDLIIMPRGISSVEFDEDARGGEGAYVEIEKLVIDAETSKHRTYILRNLTRDELVATIEEEQRRGAYFSPSPSLDQRRLVSAREMSDGYPEHEKRKR